jgi:hypothetical protein
LAGEKEMKSIFKKKKDLFFVLLVGLFLLFERKINDWRRVKVRMALKVKIGKHSEGGRQ